MNFITALTPPGHALVFLGKVGFISLACGLGPYLYVVPERVRRTFLGATLLLTLGLGVILLAVVYGLILGFNCKCAVPGGLLVSAAFLVGGLMRPSDLLGRLRAAAANVAQWKYHLALSLALSLLAVLPGTYRGLGQPWRAGIDEMGYALAAQYLLDGSSLDTLKTELVMETGGKDPGEALTMSEKSVNLNVQIAADFLLGSRRRYPALVAGILSAVGERSAISCQFAFLYLPLVLLFGVAHFFLRNAADLPDRLALFGAAVVSMNVNLLNVLCEGQHAQVFGTPLLALLMGQLLLFRNASAAGETLASPGWREYLFTGLFSALLMVSFPEMFSLAIALPLFVFGLDFLFTGKLRSRGLLRYAISLGLGLVLVAPYAASWPDHMYRLGKYMLQSTTATAGPGFWQPQWAAPAEIFGLFDIYDPAIREYVGRSPGYYWPLVLGVSLLCVAAAALRLFRGNRWDLAFWLAPVAFVLTMFVKLRFLDHAHNYQYMKAYTCVLLPLMAIFLGGLHALARNGGWKRLLLPSCGVVILVVGGLYLQRYAAEANYVALSKPEMRQRRTSIRWDNYVWMTTSADFDVLAYGSTVRMNWLNCPIGVRPPNLTPHFGKKLGIWCNRKDLPNGEMPEGDLTVVYEDNDVIFFDTGLTLASSGLGDTILLPGKENKAKARLLASCETFLIDRKVK